MTLGNLRDLYQQVILDHYKKPRHKGKTTPVHRSQKGHNPSCGDTIELTLQLNEAGDAIEDVKFEGEGCAIAMASADLMADALRGKGINEALEMVQRFQNMMKGQDEFPKELRKLNVMAGVAQFPVRIKCANLTWHTLKAALESTNGALGNGFVSNEKKTLESLIGMITTAEFLKAAQWAGILTLVCAALTVLGFILKWGIRFRLVGATGFLGVVTGGLFALSLVPLTRTVVAGAVRFSVIYDSGSTQTVIAVPPQITESQLEATLRQAASDLYSFGRLGRSNDDQLTIRARTIVHPEPGVSKPLYLGQVKRSLADRNDEQIAIEIYREKFAQLPKPTT